MPHAFLQVCHTLSDLTTFCLTTQPDYPACTSIKTAVYIHLGQAAKARLIDKGGLVPGAEAAKKFLKFLWGTAIERHKTYFKCCET